MIEEYKMDDRKVDYNQEINGSMEHSEKTRSGNNPFLCESFR